MSTHPTRLEARVSAQERQQVILNARIEELSQDMNTSFKQLVDYHIETERQIDTRFSQVDERFSQVDERFNQVDERFNRVDEHFNRVDEHFNQVDERFNRVDERLDKVETTITTIKEDIKNDMIAMEGRILDAFKQLLTMINSQRPLS